MVTPSVDDAADVAADARLLALDWGSTHLRAYLLGADGAVLDECDVDAGASAMDGDARAYAGALVRVEGGGRTVAIVPGRSCRDGNGVPDVIRGEETQIVGALAMQPDLASASTLVLPGTHSKWASIEVGRIAHFATYMTGELFALLRAHSVLGRLMQGADAPPAQGFDAGVRAAAASAGLSRQLFAVRTLGLSGEIAPDALSGCLSGLLIGSEIDAALRARGRGGASSGAGRCAGVDRLVRARAGLARRDAGAPV